MTEAEARKLLAYGGPLGDKAAVSTAFAKAVKSAHPDTGGAGGDMGALKAAREYLLSNNIATKTPCPMCGGVGIVASQAFGRQCNNCKGTGLKP